MTALTTINEIASKFINDPDYCQLFDGDIDKLKSYVDTRKLRDGFLRGACHYMTSSTRSVEDNLRNYLNGYNNVCDLVISAFMYTPSCISKEFLIQHFCRESKVKNVGNERVIKLVLQPVILNILAGPVESTIGRDCKEAVIISMLKVLEVKGDIKIRAFVTKYFVEDVSFLSLCLGLGYYKIASYIIGLNPEVFNKGIKIYKNHYAREFRIAEIRLKHGRLPYVRWDESPEHHKMTFKFVSNLIKNKDTLGKFLVKDEVPTEKKPTYIF